MKSVIRQAIRSDLERITEIYNQAILSGRATGDTETQIPEDKISWFLSHNNQQFPLMVAVWEEKVVGWLSLSPYREGRKAFRFTAEISYYIDNQFRRKGIATSLLQEAEWHCEKTGIKTLVAFLLAHNLPSIALLHKFAYSLWGTLPKIAHVSGGEFDHVFYGKRLF